MRIVFIIFGFFSLALAILGIALPLLPTTPFVLLSAFCFARSSERFHKWLITHPRFGTLITDWQEHGCISKKAKISATIVILLTLMLSIAMKVSTTILIIQGIALSISLLFILTRPSR
jgi:hypothetical protein